jgi:hypothetical protein
MDVDFGEGAGRRLAVVVRGEKTTGMMVNSSISGQNPQRAKQNRRVYQFLKAVKIIVIR